MLSGEGSRSTSWILRLPAPRAPFHDNCARPLRRSQKRVPKSIASTKRTANVCCKDSIVLLVGNQADGVFQQSGRWW